MSFNVSYNFIANDQFSGVGKDIKKTANAIKKSVAGVGKGLVVTGSVSKSVTQSVNSDFKKVKQIATLTEKSMARLPKVINAVDGEFKDVNQSAKSIVKSVGRIPNSLGAIEGEFTVIKDAAKATEKSIGRIPAIVNSVRSSFNKIKSSRPFRKVRVSAKRTMKQFRQLKREARSLGNTLKKSFGGLKSKVAGLGLIIALKAAITVGADFQDSLADLSAITGATGGDLKLLSDETLRLAKSSAIAQTEVAAAIKVVGSQRSELLNNIPALISVTDKVLLLKNAAGIELADAANIATTSMNIFGAATGDAGKFVDILAAGSVVGASEIAETGEAIIIAGGAARSAGLSFKDLNTLLQVTSKGGFKASRAGTALSSILGRLQRGKKGVFAGIDFEKADLQGTFLGIKKSLDSIVDPTKRALIATELFGEEHLKVGFALLNNAGLINKFGREIDKNGVAQKQADLRLSTFNSRMRQLGVIIKDKIIRLFERLEPTLTRLAIQFGDFVDSITPEQINAFGQDLKVFIQDAAVFGKQIAIIFKDAFQGGGLIKLKDDLGIVLDLLVGIVKAGSVIASVFKGVGTAIGESAGQLATGNFSVGTSFTDAFSINGRFLGVGSKTESAKRAESQVAAAAVKPVFDFTKIDLGQPEFKNVVKFPGPVVAPPPSVALPLPFALATPPPMPELPIPLAAPQVDQVQESRSTVDINLNAPRGVVREVRTDTIGKGSKLNVGVNMREAG